MGFRVTLLLSTKLQFAIYIVLYRGIFLCQKQTFSKKNFCSHLRQEKNCGVTVATTRKIFGVKKVEPLRIHACIYLFKIISGFRDNV